MPSGRARRTVVLRGDVLQYPRGWRTKRSMGMVHVEVEVSRADGPGRPVRFLVDSGAAYSVLPWDVWHDLGLAPERRMEFVLADGTTVERAVSHCFFAYRGVRAPGPVVLGEPAALDRTARG